MAYGDPLNSFDDLKNRSGEDLLARMIYAEARGESEKGKRGCAFVAKNRVDKNSSEFGGDTYSGVLLKSGQFAGMKTAAALKPDLSSSAWADCLDIALNLSSKTNPIGTCLWFVTNSYYNDHSTTSGGVEKYTFGGGVYTEVVEKVIIDNQTFFKVSGY